MTKTTCLLTYFFLLIFFACSNESVNRLPDNRFVDLTAFVEKQATRLDSANPSVQKRVRMGNDAENKMLQNVNWQEELEVFTQADISKPALRTSYQVTESTKLIRLFTPRTDENPDVQYLRATFDPQSKQLTAIEAHLSRTNYLYWSEKTVAFQCRTNAAGEIQIKAYQIRGFQKLIFNDPVTYEVQAQIRQ